MEYRKKKESFNMNDINDLEERILKAEKKRRKRRKQIITAVVRLLLIILVFILIIKGITSCVANINKDENENNNSKTNNTEEGKISYYTNYNNYDMIMSGDVSFEQELKSLDNLIENLTKEEMLKDFKSYTKDQFIELNNLDDIYGIRGVTFIKEYDENNQYNEITIVRCEKEDEQDLLLLKMLSRYETIKKEKLETYGKELSNIRNFNLERVGGTTVFILSPKKENFKSMIYTNYINF